MGKEITSLYRINKEIFSDGQSCMSQVDWCIIDGAVFVIGDLNFPRRLSPIIIIHFGEGFLLVYEMEGQRFF
jgi:hypothetical protein